MRVLLTGKSLLSTYGGPAYSIARLAQALAESGVEVGLWAADGSARAATSLPRGTSVRCLSGDVRDALRTFGEPNLIHDNGIWTPQNHVWARVARNGGIPRLVSVRGMLEPWARKHRRLKKAVAWWLYQRKDLETACLLHATSAAEAANLEALRLATPVRLIPNGIDIPDRNASSGEHKSGNYRRAVFVGRLHPIKGLPMLVEAWGRVRPQRWKLEIAGFDEDGHASEIACAARLAGLEDVVLLHGPITGEEKRKFLATADLFILPSYSENFGIVVAEALAHGLPVLTTRGTPWEVLEQHNCGWWVDASVGGLENGLKQATRVSIVDLRKMGDKGRTLVSTEYNWRSIAQQFADVYRECMGCSLSHVGNCRSNLPANK